jgi:hypothetical protein
MLIGGIDEMSAPQCLGGFQPRRKEKPEMAVLVIEAHVPPRLSGVRPDPGQRCKDQHGNKGAVSADARAIKFVGGPSENRRYHQRSQDGHHVSAVVVPQMA